VKLLHDREGVLSHCLGGYYLAALPITSAIHEFYTDHQALRWVLKLADAQGRLARWRLRLAEFDFQVEYRPGASNHAADTMSRLTTNSSLPVPPADTDLKVFAPEESYSLPPPVVVPMNLLIEDHQLDPETLALRDCLCKDPLWDIDQNDVLGRILPLGEFSSRYTTAFAPLLFASSTLSPKTDRT
jgi:hypothetical protein